MAITPARFPASTSRHRSPMHTLSSRSRPSRVAASRIIPGRGFRHGQSSMSSCAHTTISSSGSRARSTSCIRSTSSRVCLPRAISGWLVTTTSVNPNSRRRLQASTTPGNKRSCSTPAGGWGFPSSSSTSLSTPSRSRKIAGRVPMTVLWPLMCRTDRHGHRRASPPSNHAGPLHRYVRSSSRATGSARS